MMEQILVTYFGILLAQFQWDMEVMSQPWMYWCALVPITFYMVFFMMKWAVLTAPVWLPLSLVFSTLKRK